MASIPFTGFLPPFTVQGITFTPRPFPLSSTVIANSSGSRLASILCSYQPYYSGTGPNGSDPQTYAGSGNGLQPPWGNAWKFNIGSVISVFSRRLSSVKNAWDVEREARFAINSFMRSVSTGRFTTTTASGSSSIDSCIPVQSTNEDPYIAPVPTTPTTPAPTVKVSGTTVSIPFLTSASFKPGISAAANARGKAAFIALVKRASVASKLTKEQDAQLLATVYEAIAKAMLVKKSSLTKLKAPTVVVKKPIRKL